MSDSKSTPRPRSVDLEERGSVVTDVVVPLAQAGVGGAAAALVGNHLSKPKDPPAAPPPTPAEPAEASAPPAEE